MIYNSTCYKIHRERVNWFTAVNRCLSNNGSLAVFDDNILTYFATTLFFLHRTSLDRTDKVLVDLARCRFVLVVLASTAVC